MQRVSLGLSQQDDFVFNCQMGRGRTTTGMIAASLIATIAEEDMSDPALFEEDVDGETDVDLPEEAQYLNGECSVLFARRRGSDAAARLGEFSSLVAPPSLSAERGGRISRSKIADCSSYAAIEDWLTRSGEYKTILQLVTVLSHGKRAKRLTDRVINAMEGVQNLRRAVYE